MVSLTDRNYKPEIVSPAGNLEKMKLAVKYGADAVYFGGKEFNLRDQSGNFSFEEIKEGLRICRHAGVKSIFLMNSFLHEKDIENAKEYIKQIRDFAFNAVMVSDPGMLMLLKEAGIKPDIHLSTQMSTLNRMSIGFWKDAGIKRIVLARETTLDEIKSIREHTDAEIEIFAHGALCVSYSGRCLLSRFLSGRDANQGSCAHPCRWNYALVEEKRAGSHLEIIEHAAGTEILSSKDLSLINVLPDYVNAGVNAFKLEGRMKSLYYAANITRIYKHALQTIINKNDYSKFLPFYTDELDLVSHRPYTGDLFNEFNNLEFNEIPYIKKVLFLGYAISAGKDETEAYIKTFNPVYLNEEIDAIYPIINSNIKDCKIAVKEIIDEDKNETVEMARPDKIYLIRFNKAIDSDAILRRRLKIA
ncbi:MAG: U32 family peptidase [Spirochaetes bacterium]|nr:U32 family peptidase [Spirochaetota bacterium]